MHRYPTLIFIAKVYKGLAYLVGILAVIGVIVSLSYLENQFQRGIGITLLIQSIIGGALGVITLLAASESIKVFIDIEENTRKTTELVRGDGITSASRRPSSSASTVPANDETVAVVGENEWKCRCGRINAKELGHCPHCGRVPGAII